MKYMSPCKGCTSRHIACHGSCEEYFLFRRKVDKENAKRYLETLTYHVYERRDKHGRKTRKREY